jgi:hypothetical protein
MGRYFIPATMVVFMLLLSVSVQAGVYGVKGGDDASMVRVLK